MNDIGHNSGTDAIQRIANDLNSELGEDIESIFRKGRKFLDYKKQLGHGNFLRLFANHRDPLPEPVRCHPNTAGKFMKIAGNEELSNSALRRNLPTDFTILYELSRIDEPGLKVAFKEGWITPFIKKKDIKEIRIRLGIDDEQPPKSKKTKTPMEFIETVDQSLIDIGSHLNEAEAEEFFLRLKETVHHAENRVRALIEINSNKEAA